MSARGGEHLWHRLRRRHRIYKSTNRGQAWKLLGGTEFPGKGIGKIMVHPVARTRSTSPRRPPFAACLGVLRRRHPAGARHREVGPSSRRTAAARGTSSTTAQSTRPLHRRSQRVQQRQPGCLLPAWRQVHRVRPVEPSIIYAGSYARGVWRSTDGGANWTRIKPSLNAAIIQTRPATWVNELGRATRMYVYEGHAAATVGTHRGAIRGSSAATASRREPRCSRT